MARIVFKNEYDCTLSKEELLDQHWISCQMMHLAADNV